MESTQNHEHDYRVACTEDGSTCIRIIMTCRCGEVIQKVLKKEFPEES